MSRPPSSHLVQSDALELWLDLGRALVDVLTPCQRDRAAFTSDDPGERAKAAEACSTCPVLARCRTYAEAQGESWGVWGGIDRSDRRASGAACKGSPW